MSDDNKLTVIPDTVQVQIAEMQAKIGSHLTTAENAGPNGGSMVSDLLSTAKEFNPVGQLIDKVKSAEDLGKGTEHLGKGFEHATNNVPAALESTGTMVKVGVGEGGRELLGGTAKDVGTAYSTGYDAGTRRTEVEGKLDIERMKARQEFILQLTEKGLNPDQIGQILEMQNRAEEITAQPMTLTSLCTAPLIVAGTAKGRGGR